MPSGQFGRSIPRAIRFRPAALCPLKKSTRPQDGTGTRIFSDFSAEDELKDVEINGERKKTKILGFSSMIRLVAPSTTSARSARPTAFHDTLARLALNWLTGDNIDPVTGLSEGRGSRPSALG
jgi:hypothetical protein